VTTAADRAAALYAEGHAAAADMRPARGARLLRAALRLVSGPPGAEPDPATAELRGQILVSLAYAEAEQGRLDLGWRLLAEAESLLPGRSKALAFSQRALLYMRTGKDDAAIGQYDLALAHLREESDPAAVARALLNRGTLHLGRGRLQHARADLRGCAAVSALHDLSRILPIAVHNLGYLDYLAGDIPAALRTYREVAGQYAAVKPGMLAVLAVDRARALTAAGLFAEADEELAGAVEQFRRRRSQQDHAEALLARAEAALLAGAEKAAGRWAAHARREFLRRDNRRWAASAALVALRARSLRPGSAGSRLALAAEARDLAGTLRGLGLAEDSRQAGYLAVRALLAAGQTAVAEQEAAKHRPPRRVDRLETHMLWRLSRAEQARAGGRPGEAFRQLAEGMATLRRRRGQLGSLDLQTGAAVHGREIVRAGLGAALRTGAVATVYRWSELSRAQALLLPPATPPDEPAATAALEELRQVRHALRGAELAGRPTAGLRQRAAALERSLREHSWSAAGRGGGQPLAPLPRVRAELGDAAMVVYLRDGARLHALVVTARHTRLLALGEHAGAVETVRRVRADLDAQAGRRLPARLADSVAAATRRDAAALAAAVLDPVRPFAGDRDLVVVPTGELVAVPWAALPGCAGRPVTVAPSATTWLAARRRLDQPGRRTADGDAGHRGQERLSDQAGPAVLVSGPGLDRAEAEVRAIAELYPDATVLSGPDATSAATAKAWEGAALAHVAAHGHHQQENPLFSSLDLADGPLMGYDLHRLHTPPALVVLASCDLGLADVRPGDETVGMTTALLAAGTSTVVAAVTRIADHAALPLMARLHERLRRGGSPAAALAGATAADPLSGFVCFGGG
jgi:CHAT domain-containing protein/tetratricopeptide (TPR) repeat protein